MIAALYIDRAGPYWNRPDVDAWDAERDATNYSGPWPVVAHPPCGPWGRYHHRSRHQRKDLAIRAIDQVRRWGGVLEHPHSSQLWKDQNLTRPGEFLDRFGGWSLDLSQCWWGHPAQKKTRLYIVGLPRLSVSLPTFRPGQTALLENLAKSKRHLTPPAFAEWLIELAKMAWFA